MADPTAPAMGFIKSPGGSYSPWLGQGTFLVYIPSETNTDNFSVILNGAKYKQAISGHLLKLDGTVGIEMPNDGNFSVYWRKSP